MWRIDRIYVCVPVSDTSYSDANVRVRQIRHPRPDDFKRKLKEVTRSNTHILYVTEEGSSAYFEKRYDDWLQSLYTVEGVDIPRGDVDRLYGRRVCRDMFTEQIDNLPIEQVISDSDSIVSTERHMSVVVEVQPPPSLSQEVMDRITSDYAHIMSAYPNWKSDTSRKSMIDYPYSTTK